MPRYYGTDPTEYYRNSYFDPLTGRLRGGQMVMDFLNRIAEEKKKKQEASWELEDRGWLEEQRRMAREKYGQEQEAYEYEKKNRVSPWLKMLFDWREKKKDIEARKKADIEVAKVRAGVAESNEAERETRQDLLDARRTFATSRKVKRDRITAIQKELKSIDDQIAKVDAKFRYAKLNKLEDEAKIIRSEWERLNNQKGLLQKEFDGLAEEVLSGPSNAPTGPVYVNPTTGQRIRWDGANWVPVR